MKRIYLVGVFSIISLFISAQAGQWVWLHGPNFPSSLGNRGTKGVPSPANDPPSMYEPCEWKDKNGNFWIYGGLSTTFNSCYPDLWKYDPVNKTWTWMTGSGIANDAGNWGVQGIPSPSNHPPALSWGVTSWVDTSGNLWMMGGQNYTPVGLYSDMWKYDISTNEWTWMKGPGTVSSLGYYGVKGVADPANNPRLRGETAGGWTDANNNLWLFGGADGCNDMWRYEITTNTWTWMKGDSVNNTTGVYGTKGVEAPANNPPGDFVYAKWKDDSGNFWVFGHSYNGLFRYNPTTNNWTWMNGNNYEGPGAYGTKCVASTTNLPPSRNEHRASWTDGCGNFWMFGGLGYNDLWMYNPKTDKWVWVNGDNVNYAAGSWGIKGVYNPANKPSGRKGSVSWIDNNNNLYLFGGCDDPYSSYYNDLWKFVIDTSCVGPVSCVVIPPVANFTAADTTLCQNDCVNFTNLSINADSWEWTFSGGLPLTSTEKNPQFVCYTSEGTFDVKLIAKGSGTNDTLVINNYVNVHPAPLAPVITQAGNVLYCGTDTAYKAYQWYDDTTLIPGATDTLLVISHSGNYNVQVTNQYSCKIAVGINVILGMTGIRSKDGDIYLFPNPAGDICNLHLASFKKSDSYKFTLTDLLGQVVFESEIKNQVSAFSISSLPPGIYFAEVTGENERWISRFVRQ